MNIYIGRKTPSPIWEVAVADCVARQSVKSAVFGSSSSLPLLVGEGGGLVCELDGKAHLLLDDFDSK